MNEPLRIAMYGYTERDSGSVSSAGWLILRGLLRRDYAVDFFGDHDFVYPKEFHEFPNFSFVDVARPRLGALFKRLLSWKNPIWWALIGIPVHRVHAGDVMRAMRRRNRTRNYDLVFFSGTWAFGRVGDTPVVSWVQGPPATDCRSIRNHARQIIDLCGWREFLKLRLYALYRENLAVPPFRHSDAIACGSQWAKQSLVGCRLQAESIHAAPYPVDLEKFHPASHAPEGTPVVLWVGRVVPRKRLDLFLHACQALLEEGVRLRVVVIGGFPFASGYRALLGSFRYPELLEYHERVPRQAMSERFGSATVFVQPSEDENFGSSVAEALASGLRVVVGPSNGTMDYLGGSGFVFERYDVDSVKRAIGRALDDAREAGLQPSPRARTAAEKFFDPEAIVDSFDRLIRKLCNAQPGSESDDRSPTFPVVQEALAERPPQG